MRSLTTRQCGPLDRACRLGFMAAGLLLMAAQPASAATWGHLRGPFSTESEQLERANFAAEERASHRDMAELAAAGQGAVHRVASCRIWRSALNRVGLSRHRA